MYKICSRKKLCTHIFMCSSHFFTKFFMLFFKELQVLPFLFVLFWSQLKTLYLVEKQNQENLVNKVGDPGSKKRSNQKNKGTLYIIQIGGFYFESLTLLFWFDLFLEARAEILEKISLLFWSKRWHQKDISKLTDL